MKTLKLFFVISQLIVVCSIIGCAPLEKDSKVAFNEDDLDLSANPISEKDGIAEMELCHDSVRIDGKIALDLSADSIKYGSFAKLVKYAKTLGDTTQRHVLGLKMFFGINSGLNKIHLLYQPLFLQKDTGANKNYTPIGDSIYQYDYATSKFVPATDLADTTRYRQHVRFFKGNVPFNTSDADTGSVRSLVFSFQEIKDVAKHNYKAPINDSLIFMLNAADTMRVNNICYLRHSILLGPDMLKHRFVDIFFRKYGNLSHLCPPSCNKHQFDVK